MKTKALIAIISFASLSIPALAIGPAIQFESTVHEFDQIYQGETLDVVFSFANNGAETLVIEEITTACGCTSTELAQSSYEPGETGSISVSFDSDRFLGQVSKLITVISNATNSPKTALTIQGTVIVDVNLEPTSLLFSKVAKTEQVVKEIRVSTELLDTLELSNLRTDPGFLSAQITRVDDKNATITVTIDGTSFPEGKTRLTASLTLDTNSPRQPTIRVAMTISVDQPFRAIPGSLFFYASKIGTARTIELKILAAGRAPFTISEIESDLDFISARVAGDDGPVIVTFSGDTLEGKFQGSLTVKTTTGTEIVIPIKGDAS